MKATEEKAAMLIPEVEMLYKTIDYIAETDTSDGNIKDTAKHLKEYILKLVKESIIFNQVKLNAPTVQRLNVDTDAELVVNEDKKCVAVKVSKYFYNRKD